MQTVAPSCYFVNVVAADFAAEIIIVSRYELGLYRFLWRTSIYRRTILSKGPCNEAIVAGSKVYSTKGNKRNCVFFDWFLIDSYFYRRQAAGNVICLFRNSISTSNYTYSRYTRFYTMFRSTTIHYPSETFDPRRTSQACSVQSWFQKQREKFSKKGKEVDKGQSVEQNGRECRERTIQTTTRVDTLDGHFSSWTITRRMDAFFFYFKRRASRIPPIRVHGGWPPWRAMIYDRPENICAWVSDCAWPEIWPNIFICEREPVREREREKQKGKMHIRYIMQIVEWMRKALCSALWRFPLNG